MPIVNHKPIDQGPSDASDWKRLDPEQLTRDQQYKLLTGSILPRPIALVTTIGPNGLNAAPFSFFNMVAVEPPTIMLSIGSRNGMEKDTLANLRETPEFVAHIVSDDIKEQTDLCGEVFPADVNEIEIAGFKVMPSERVSPPRIRECAVQFECVVKEIIPVGLGPYHVVFGEVVLMHFRESLLNSAMRVDFHKLNPIARLAGPRAYARITDNFVLDPPAL